MGGCAVSRAATGCPPSRRPRCCFRRLKNARILRRRCTAVSSGCWPDIARRSTCSRNWHRNRSRSGTTAAVNAADQAFSGEVDTGSRNENASNKGQEPRFWFQSEPNGLQGPLVAYPGRGVYEFAQWGHVAEWLRNGLQNRVHQFNSGRGLQTFQILRPPAEINCHRIATRQGSSLFLIRTANLGEGRLHDLSGARVGV